MGYRVDNPSVHLVLFTLEKKKRLEYRSFLMHSKAFVICAYRARHHIVRVEKAVTSAVKEKLPDHDDVSFHTFDPRSVYLDSSFLLLASRPLDILSRMLSRSLSSFSLVMTTLEGAMPIGTDWPLVLSRVTRSTCTTYLRR